MTGATDPVYSIDTNLWGRSVQCGVFDDPWQEAPADIFTLTREPAVCAGEAAYVEVGFEQGVPVTVNGVAMPLVELVGCADDHAGDAWCRTHRHGRKPDRRDQDPRDQRSARRRRVPRGAPRSRAIRHSGATSRDSSDVVAVRTRTWCTRAAGSRRHATRSTPSSRASSSASPEPFA